MEHKAQKLHPSAPLDNIDLEQRLEKKLSDVKSFDNSFKNNKEMITYVKDKNHYSKKRSKKCKNSKHNIRIIRQNSCYWSNVNFYNFVDYWY